MIYYYQIRRAVYNGKLCHAGEVEAVTVSELLVALTRDTQLMMDLPGDTLELSTEPFPEEEVLN